MSSSMPRAQPIDVPDAPPVSCVEFLGQVLGNVSNQVDGVEGELRAAADSTNLEQIKQLSEHVARIKASAANVLRLTSSLKDNPSLLASTNAALAVPGRTLVKIDKVLKIIKELEQELQNGEFDYYRVLAELYSDLMKELAQFECLDATPHMHHIRAKVNAIESELKRQVQWCVREMGSLVFGDSEVNPNNPGPEINVDAETLGQVYLVVDALGIAFRRDLSERIAQLQLLPYEKAFKFGTKHCGTESLEKRFVWFRILLKTYNQKLGQVFPRKWCLPQYLFLEFSRRTKKHISDYLASQEKVEMDIQERVSSMLLSLKHLITFEEEMKAAFAVYIRGEDVDPGVLESKVPMAEAFDPFLGPYIQLEREQLEAIMNKLGEEEMQQMNACLDPAADASAKLSVAQPAFESSQKMFEFIKASLKRCNSFSSGVTYLSLSREFRVCLHNYALSLKFRHPSPVSAKAGERPVYQISKAMEVQLCRLIKTGEYCIDTIPQLESKMKEHIQDEYKDNINFSEEIDAFQDMITATIALINTGIMEKVYPLLGREGMRSIDWSDDSHVGDENEYIKEIFAVLNDTVPRIRMNLSTIYFQQFCMKMSTTVLDALLENIWKLKRISVEGSSQLMLDIKTLENYLIKMPRTLLSEEEAEQYPPSTVYVNLIKGRISRIETILKLVCMEDDQLAEMLPVMWPDATEKDKESIMALKARHMGQVISSGVVSTVGDIKTALTLGLLGGGNDKKKSSVRASGKGKIRNSDGSFYDGEYKNGKCDGYGLCYFKNGDIYEGDWKEGKFHGRGLYRYRSGDIFEGNYENGHMVHGTYIHRSGPLAGNIYEGDWKDGQMHGRGLYRINAGPSSGNSYEGGFQKGRFQGHGVYRFSNGDVFEGEFVNSRKEGPGVLRLASGSEQRGLWVKGTFKG